MKGVPPEFIIFLTFHSEEMKFKFLNLPNTILVCIITTILYLITTIISQNAAGCGKGYCMFM